MTLIDTKAYLLRMFIDNFMFVFLFYMTNTKIQKKKFWIMFLMVIIRFFFDLFIEFTEFIPIIFGYCILREENEDKKLIINKLLFCLLINKVIFITSSVLISSPYNRVSYLFVLEQITTDYILASLFIYAYRKLYIKLLIEKYSSKTTMFLVVYVIAIMEFVGYTAQKLEIFDQFVFGILLFLVLQTLFVMALFTWMTIKQKEKYEQKVKDKELIYLKKYTDALEKDQEQSARFRHDYKNLLLSLKERATFYQDLALKEQIESLEHYSQPYLIDKFAYRYLKNVKNEYVKSLLLSKMYEANQRYIRCIFECPNELYNIPLDIFDFIRVLGILIDNALEAAVESDEKEMSIAIYQDETQLEFTVINSVANEMIALEKMTQKGITTKEGHQGLGLSNIEEINKKNKNMFVNYRVESKRFLAQVVVLF